MSDEHGFPEPFAKRILAAAIQEDRAGDLLVCLMSGGAATVDAQDGTLVLISGDQLSLLAEDAHFQAEDVSPRGEVL